MPPAETRPDPAFHVPAFLHVAGGLVHRNPRFWRWLGRRETAALRDAIESVRVDRPIYVCGLARSGSTLLHEVAASHSGVATHRGKDYPMLFTPYWWRRATAGLKPPPPQERPHGDGVMVTPDSPDALEEMVWTAFFPRCHDPSVPNVMDGSDRHPPFEAFYDAHVRKLMLAESAGRYVAKANYHVARLPYLLRLYPDARVLIPVRSPADHVVSLLRQHRRFSAAQQKHPRLQAYMWRTGHFEFGMDRRPTHLGDAGRVRQVIDAWAAGDEVRGLALYWDMTYRYLADLLAADSRVRAATHVVRFGDVCREPEATLRAALEHCELSDAASVARREAAAVRAPTTSANSLSPAEVRTVREITAETADRWAV